MRTNKQKYKVLINMVKEKWKNKENSSIYFVLPDNVASRD